MNIYTSRFSNPELKSGKYTCIRISLGSPRWGTGYQVKGAINCLMPFGLLNKYNDYELFKQAYFKLLDSAGVNKISDEINRLSESGKDVVLLCFEDVRKEEDWCHRTAFREWWKIKTGHHVKELVDPTPAPKAKPLMKKEEPTITQLTMG